MTKLAQRPGAEAAPVAVDVAGSSRPAGEQVEQMLALEAFPAWSSLSWEERGDYVARYCLS